MRLEISIQNFLLLKEQKSIKKSIFFVLSRFPAKNFPENINDYDHLRLGRIGLSTSSTKNGKKSGSFQYFIVKEHTDRRTEQLRIYIDDFV